jgi:recombinational DNA repair protein (RecF pathway)
MPLREHDQLVVLYGQETGRMAAIAKSSLRAASRQALAIDEGNMISCALAPGRAALPILTGAQAQRCWSSAKADPLAWAVAQFFLQAIDAIVYDAQPDAELWGALTGTLDALDRGAAPLEALRMGQAAILEVLGYGRRDPAPSVAVPCDADMEFDRIAQRHLSALDLVYSLARTP